jgi:MoaA/NifB/PqqE/SkfB family radical SAM enzyme
MEAPDRPPVVVWDITYACPLRCVHCYSESGRRPSRQLSHDDMLRVADAIVSLAPDQIVLAGGEPLAVRRILDVARRLASAGSSVSIYTGGWLLTAPMTEAMTKVLAKVVVSVDGATPDMHDSIRGRKGSFDRAMNALALLDDAAREHRAGGNRPWAFGLDYVVTRSNVDQVERVCTEIVPRFPRLQVVSFGAVVPVGLASRPTFNHELLTDAQVQRLLSAEYVRHLQSLVPSSVMVSTTDNTSLQMRPDRVERGDFLPAMVVEPDGEVRGLALYEGTVGNLLTEPADLLWRRSVARWTDPFVVQTLSRVRGMSDWAEAARRLDHRFGSADVRARIDARPAFVPLTRLAAG